MSRISLTHKQQAALEFIQRYFDEHRRSPLIREIQAGCAIVSYKSALDRLNALERKGLIKRTPSKHRGIRIIRKLVLAQTEKQPVLASVAGQPGSAGELEAAGEGIAS